MQQTARDRIFEELVTRYRRPLTGAAYHLCGDSEAARDLVQETLLDAYHELATLREPEKAGAWLFTGGTPPFWNNSTEIGDLHATIHANLARIACVLAGEQADEQTEILILSLVPCTYGNTFSRFDSRSDAYLRFVTRMQWMNGPSDC